MGELVAFIDHGVVNAPGVISRVWLSAEDLFALDALRGSMLKKAEVLGNVEPAIVMQMLDEDQSREIDAEVKSEFRERTAGGKKAHVFAMAMTGAEELEGRSRGRRMACSSGRTSSASKSTRRSEASSSISRLRT